MAEDPQRIGSYELIEPIGSGGMGEVWRCKHHMLRRHAALKVIRPETLGPTAGVDAATVLRRFAREAQATSELKSPHTIELYDFGITDDGAFYYVMELLEGRDLQSLVKTFGALPPERVVYLLEQICESLGEAHEQGLIHRDIKPANIFLCKLGLRHDFAKVLDFGLVKTVRGEGGEQSLLTVDGVTPGSPAFMAPELIAGKDEEIDARTDLYSLGCVAYWLLVGELVFPRTTAIEFIVAHLQSAPEPLSTRTEQRVPSELEQLVLACLAKDRADRPRDVREVMDVLARIQFEEPWTPRKAEQWWAEFRPARDPGTATMSRGDLDERAKQLARARAARPSSGDGDGPPLVSAELITATDVERAAGGGTLPTVPDPPRVATELAPLSALPGEAELSGHRERVLGALQRHFEQSHIDVHEFDRRSEAAQLADSPDTLRDALDGLPVLPVVPASSPQPTAPAPRASPAPAPQTGARVPAARPDPSEWSNMVAIFGGMNRTGSWTPKPNTRVICAFGGGELDFRRAKMQPGMTELRFYAGFGGAKVIVPPEMYVETDGVGVFGAFIQEGHGAAEPPDDGPWLRVTGLAVFGGVEVAVEALDAEGDRRSRREGRHRRRLEGPRFTPSGDDREDAGDPESS